MKKDPLSEESRFGGDNVGASEESSVENPTPIVVMGPAGSGKTTLGKRLASALKRPFVDADDHHPLGNVEKMRAGIGLTDEDREPWLVLLRQLLEREPSVVMACSALKKSYRTVLRPAGEKVSFVLLDVPKTELATRLEARQDHYAGGALLDSQLATLERPSNELGAFVIDGSGPEDQVFSRTLTALRLKKPGDPA